MRIKRKEVVTQHTSERNKATQNRIDKKYNKGEKTGNGLCREKTRRGQDDLRLKRKNTCGKVALGKRK